MANQEWPTTVEQAVARVLAALDEATKTELRGIDEDDLPELHFELGMWIRNQFGLWGGNSALKAATGVWHPDDASTVIIAAVIKALRVTDA